MQGPDFLIERLATWTEHPASESALILADGSRWLLDARRADYAAQRAFIIDAMGKGESLFVSGSRERGIIDRVAAAKRLAALRLGAAPKAGRISILFAGPPSIYYLRMDRPDAARSLDLLRRSAAADPMPSKPDLLVGIDTVTSEVILVHPLPDGSAAEPR